MREDCRIACRLQQTDQNCIAIERRELIRPVSVGPLNFQDHLRAGINRRCIWNHARAGGAISIVRKSCCSASTCLHRDRVSEFYELRNYFRDKRDTLLTWNDFLRYGKSHSVSLPFVSL